ncbi:hypothetical protein fugu_017357, partial [Takifugu bimaculatus]
MEISKSRIIVAFLVTFTVVEINNFVGISSPGSPVHNEEKLLPHAREKRDALPHQWNYIVDVVVNASDAETFGLFRDSLNAVSFPQQLDNNTNITDISITTVCSSTSAGFGCRCADQFAWPYSSCVTYGACGDIAEGICDCITAIPPDGQSCQPFADLQSQVEYIVDVELNITDNTTLDYLRNILSNVSSVQALYGIVNITDIDVTTVCYPNGTNFQCRCEDQYTWPYNKCSTYGTCDGVSKDTCSCILGIPTDGQFCQPKTVPAVVYEYEILIEVNTSDIDQLRNALKSITFPASVSTHTNISDATITTVCGPTGGSFQCQCEAGHLWPCDKCVMYGKCDNDTNTCGCIRGFPTDGQHCQAVHRQNYSTCQSPTAPSGLQEYLVSVELNFSDVSALNQLKTLLNRTVFPFSINDFIEVSDVNITMDPTEGTTELNTTTPPMTPTAVVTNSTSTTDLNTTTPPVSSTTPFTNSTPTTDLNNTTFTTVVVTNSTLTSATSLNTTIKANRTT